MQGEGRTRNALPAVEAVQATPSHVSCQQQLLAASSSARYLFAIQTYDNRLPEFLLERTDFGSESFDRHHASSRKTAATASEATTIHPAAGLGPRFRADEDLLPHLKIG